MIKKSGFWDGLPQERFKLCALAGIRHIVSTYQKDTDVMIRILIACLILQISIISLAYADIRALYTIRDIEVKTQADSVLEAQQEAFDEVRIDAAETLLRKITLPQDRQDLNHQGFSASEAAGLAAAVEIQEETRGGNNYAATLSVVINPTAMRAYLEAQSIPYMDRQAPKSLLVPTARRAEFSDWYASWEEADPGLLTPYVKTETAYTADTNWLDLQSEVGLTGSQRALFVDLQDTFEGWRVEAFIRVAGHTIPIGQTAPQPTLADAHDATIEMLSLHWKKQSIVRSEARTFGQLTVLYTSLPEWTYLRSAFVQSPLISDFQIKSIAAEGAFIEFAYAGDQNRLRADFLQRGLSLNEEAIGWVVRSASSGG